MIPSLSGAWLHNKRGLGRLSALRKEDLPSQGTPPGPDVGRPMQVARLAIQRGTLITYSVLVCTEYNFLHSR